VVIVGMLSPSTPAGKRGVGRAAWLGHPPALQLTAVRGSDTA
jgi:hypothetical protein